MNDDVFLGKKIVLGVTGGIAAYKSCQLIRDLKTPGAVVRVIMTPSACEFITPLTLSTLSQNNVIVNHLPSNQNEGVSLQTWHIDYGIWADLMIIAPCTVNTIAKIAHGFADNSVTTVVSALRSKLIIAPAADVDMYENSINLDNLEKLRKRNIFIVEGESGFLASGLEGKGRLANNSKIIDQAELVLSDINVDLKNKNILVTAGPTFEDIDPVRYLGNRSSGKMGYSIAKAAYLRGANVTLISGPTSESIYPEIKLISIRNASEMKTQIDANISENDALIMSAAVADFTPQNYSLHKIKKETEVSAIDLKETEDILYSIKNSKIKKVGFALETENGIENAKKKLTAKNLDFVVLNSLLDKDAGFEFATNKITIIGRNGQPKEFPLESKFQVANKILTELKKTLNEN
ncbi:MAG: bifunctional phosphopantothenoylcysteine decarboxylase/phosphopantothenate--cysteine ligase CoaBC [Melioribacteraceae bacterium]|nr:bifunctional phosphopantothenoylcysteine decarboxylase/phosphopantothenate--cysteine ligase CoaBC [Melioribacteraceae bacterium]